MRKLLHLVFAVRTTNRPFHPNPYPWHHPDAAPGASADTATGDMEPQATTWGQHPKRWGGYPGLLKRTLDVPWPGPTCRPARAQRRPGA
jgi:hypothetical protein